MSRETVPSPGGASAPAAAVQVKSTHPLFKWLGSLHTSVTSRRRSYLPLPVSLQNIRFEELQGLLLDIHKHTLDNLHICQTHLQFWRRQLEDKDYAIGQEGPYFQHSEPFLVDNDPGENNITRAASDVLTNVRYYLAHFLSKVYKAVDEFSSESSLIILEKLQSYLADLNTSLVDVTRTNAVGTVDIDKDLVQLPTEKDVTIYFSIIKTNFLMLDKKVSSLVCKFAKPRRLRWKHVAGAVAMSIISIWLVSYIRHSDVIYKSFLESLDGSLTLPMRTEVMELGHAQSSKDYLRRMLLNFGKTRHQTFPDLIDEAKAELILFEAFNDQLKSPLKTLMKGDILSALIIQAQMIKSLAVTRLEFYERIWAYGFRIVMCRALPAVIVSVVVFCILRAWSLTLRTRSKKSKRTSCRLICEARKRIEQYLQVLHEQANENDAKFLHGLVLYTLDHFYNCIEKEARAKEEWESMREDIVAIENVKSEAECNVLVERILTYECLRFRDQ